MKAAKIARTLGPALAATLLGACASAPPTRGETWQLEPVMRVRHGAESAAGYYALGRYEERRVPADRALAAYRKAVEAEPAYVAAWDALGTLLARLGQFDDALRTLERAVALAPTASRLHNNLGYALMLAGRNETAAATLRRAVELDENNRRAWRNLAEAYRRLGEFGNAGLADARADGRRPDEIDAAATPAAKPMPMPTDSAALVPKAAPTATATTPPATSPPTPLVPIRPGSRLVKLAENIYALRTAHAPVKPAPDTKDAAPVRPAPAPASKPAGTPPGPIRYEVSNGHGSTGLARRVASLLRQHGFAVPRLTNRRPFDTPITVLQYGEGFRAAAEELAAGLPFRPMVAVTATAGLSSDVRLLLGKDLSSGDTCATLDLCPRIAAGRSQPPIEVSATSFHRPE